MFFLIEIIYYCIANNCKQDTLKKLLILKFRRILWN